MRFRQQLFRHQVEQGRDAKLHHGVQHQADGQRHDHRQPRYGALLVLERAAPFNPVARRQLDRVRQFAPSNRLTFQ